MSWSVSDVARASPSLCEGKLIGDVDLLIASHALSHQMTLVTNNIEHFSSVSGLKVEVWS